MWREHFCRDFVVVPLIVQPTYLQLWVIYTHTTHIYINQVYLQTALLYNVTQFAQLLYCLFAPSR